MNLTDFSLCGISVTDAVLQHLTGRKNLTYLDLSYCHTSKAAEEALRQQIPGLEIRHDRDEEESDEDSEGELSD